MKKKRNRQRKQKLRKFTAAEQRSRRMDRIHRMTATQLRLLAMSGNLFERRKATTDGK